VLYDLPGQGNNRGLNIQESEKTALFDILELLEVRPPFCRRRFMSVVRWRITPSSPAPWLYHQQYQNPNPKPCEGFISGTSMLAGEWRLIYTNAFDVLSLGILPVRAPSVRAVPAFESAISQALFHSRYPAPLFRRR
jgi:hypothetical protein